MYPKTTNEVHNLILETLDLEEQAGKLLLKIDKNKETLKQHFDKEGTKRIDVPIESSNGKVTVVCKASERANITYDVEKLKKKVDNEVFIEVTKREYKILDIDEMIKLMKSAGIRARDFKKLIEPIIKVDGQAVKRLYDAGEITMKQLKGTFTAKITKSIKITEEKSE